ncbi:MAG: HepT-like ribonuclease domain-containing protein [Flavobacteriales bacterium]
MRDRLGDRIRVQHVLEAIELIDSFTKGRSIEDLSNDAMFRFAVVKQLEVIGEATSRITEGTLSMEPSIAWKQVVLMRHVLVHDYYRIDVPTVWSTVTIDLPPLKQAVMRLLDALPPAP